MALWEKTEEGWRISSSSSSNIYTQRLDNSLSELFWIFMNSLPEVPKQIVRSYLNIPIANRIADIFKTCVLDKEQYFKLYSTWGEIQEGPIWHIRDDLSFGMVELDGNQSGNKNVIQGSSYINYKYTRGTEVKLWWIRKLNPFYKMKTSFYHSPIIVWNFELIWGTGPSIERLNEYRDLVLNDAYSRPRWDKMEYPKPITELDYRKNACCMAMNGCSCANLVLDEHHY